MLPLFILSVTLEIQNSRQQKGWYDVFYPEYEGSENANKAITDDNGIICQIKTSSGFKKLTNMAETNHDGLKLSLDASNKNANWIEIVHKVENTGNSEKQFDFGCYAYLNLYDQNDLSISKFPNSKAFSILGDEGYASMYMNGKDSSYTYPDRFSYNKRDDQEHFYDTLQEDAQDIENDNIQVSFSWNQKISPHHILKLPIKFYVGHSEPLDIRLNGENSYSFVVNKESSIKLDIYVPQNQDLMAGQEVYKLLMKKGNEEWETVAEDINSDTTEQTVTIQSNEEGTFHYQFQLVKNDEEFVGSNVLEVDITFKEPPKIVFTQPDTNKYQIGSDLKFTYVLKNGDGSYTAYYYIKKDGSNVYSDNEQLSTSGSDVERTKTIHLTESDFKNGGEYQLQIQLVSNDNDNDLSTEPFTFTLVRELIRLSLSDVEFTPTILSNGDTFRVTGKVNSNGDPMEIFIYIGDKKFLENIGREKSFSIERKISEITCGEKTVRIYASPTETVDRNDDSPDVTKTITITDKPVINFENAPENGIYRPGDEINLNLVINDDTKGSYNYTFFNTIGRDNYTTSGGVFRKTLNLVVPQETQKGTYSIEAAVTDEFSLTGTTSFNFQVKYQPQISVTLQNTTVDDEKPIIANIAVTDKDIGKQLYLIVELDGTRVIEEEFSSDTTNAFNNKEISSSSPGKKKLEIWVAESKGTKESNSIFSISNIFSENVTYSRAPILNINPPENLVVGSNDQLRFTITIIDDTNGSLHYYIDDEPLSGNINDGDASYDARESKTIDINATIPVNTDKYKKGNHTLKVIAVDEFGIESGPKTFDFMVKNIPVISIDSKVPKVVPPNSNMSVTLDIYDADGDETFYVYYKINNNDFEKIGEKRSSGRGLTQIDLTIPITESVGDGNTITFYVIDNLDGITNGNSKSKDQQFNFNIKIPPKIVDLNLTETIFKKGDSLVFSGKVDYSVDGFVSFKIDSTENRNWVTSYTVSDPTFEFGITIPNSLTYGNHILKIIVDSNDRTSAFIERNITYKNPPTLKDVSIHPDSISGNEDVKLSGKVNDIDENKKIYIIYQLGQGTPRRADDGYIQSDGQRSDKEFTYTIKNLASLGSSGNLSIWASDNPDASAPPGKYSISNIMIKPITIVTPPKLTIITPEKTIYQWGEKIKFSVTITDDVKGKLTFKIVGNSQGQNYDFNGYSVDYNGTETKNVELPVVNEPCDYYKLSIKATGEDTGVFDLNDIFEFLILNRPNITKVDISSNVVAPGTEIDYEVSFTDFDAGKSLALYCQFPNTQGTVLTTQPSNGGPSSFSGQISVPSDATKGPNTVMFWIDTLNLEVQSNKESEKVPITITVTDKPTVTFSFPSDESEYITSDQKMKFSVEVTDDSNGNITITDDSNGNILKIIPYTTTQKSFTDELALPEGAKYPSCKLVAIATDEYGLSSIRKTNTYKIRNRPNISATITPSFVRAGEQIHINGYVIDIDKNKLIGVYIEFATQQTYKLGEFNSVGGKKSFEYDYTIPGATQLGSKDIKIYAKEIESTEQPQNKFKTSETITGSVTITSDPTVNCELSTLYISTGQTITVSGTTSAKSPITIKYGIDNDQLETQQVSFEGESYQISKTLTIPEKYGYEKHKITVQVFEDDTNRHTAVLEMPFHIKNKPTIEEDISFSEENPLESGSIEIIGKLSDKDKTKNVYIYAQADEETIQQIGSIVSDGSSKSFNCRFKVPSKFGKKNIKIWASDQDNPNNVVSNFDKSETKTKSLYVTYKPILSGKLNGDDAIFKSEDEASVKITVKDDTKVNLRFYFDDKLIENMNTEIKSNNRQNTSDYKVKIPSNTKYGKYTLKVTAIDEHQKETETPFIKLITIKNKPEIKDISVDKNELFMDDTSTIKFTLNDIDSGKKLYFFAGINEDDAVKIGEHQSKGETAKELSFSYKVPTNAGSGQKTIKVWAQDYPDRKSIPLKYSTSEAKSFEMTIKYRPSVSVEFPKEDTQYNDGGKIPIKGTITANAKSTLILRIDDTELKSQNKEFEMENGQKKFDFEVEIPDTIKYGHRILYVKVKDEVNNIQSVEKSFKFYMRNNPKINEVTMTQSSVKQGESVQIKGKVMDPDNENRLEIRARIGDDANKEFVVKKDIVSNTEYQDFEGSLMIPEDAKTGKTKIYVYAVDQDGLKSSEVSFELEIVPKLTVPNDEDSKGGKAGKIAGSVVGVLLAIIIATVVAVILIKKRAENNNISEQEDDMPTEPETMIINNNANVESATIDNPLFTTNVSDDELFEVNETDTGEVDVINI